MPGTGSATDSVTDSVTDEEIFSAHAHGKLRVESRVALDSQRALSIAYTPGVAQVCRAIAAEPSLANPNTVPNLGKKSRG